MSPQTQEAARLIAPANRPPRLVNRSGTPPTRTSTSTSTTTSTSSRAQPSTPTQPPRKSKRQARPKSGRFPAVNTPNQNLPRPTPSGQIDMSSQRSRAPRSGHRAASDDDGIDKALIANQILKAMTMIAEGEKKAKLIKERILALEQRMRKKKEDNIGVPISDHNELEALYRESVKIAEEQRVRAMDDSLLTQVQLLKDVQAHDQEDPQSARNSSSRASNMDLDGPSDSPVPSPADNRHVRKIGGSRTSSQPPRSITDKLDGTASEASERASKPKIMYSLKDEVAFKRKIPGGKPEDQDWIQGEVVRVIGEGKSRRYDVKDIDPDAGGLSHKSSASQMVPIPPAGTPLGDYEPGKQVLALYPAATTFYRAQVKSMVDGGTRVLVLFEEEDVEKSIARRFVLDHKG